MVRDHSRPQRNTIEDAPESAVSVGKGVAEHAASISLIDLPAGRKGSRTVPVGTGMTSEQSVRVL